jgi:hypothetical protein
MRIDILFFLVVATCLYSCEISVAKGRNGASFKNAIEYNDYIVGRQQKVARFIDHFVRASSVSSDSALVVLDKSAQETDGFLKDIAAMSDFKGDSAFRNAAVQTFTFYKRILSEDYKKLMQINTNGEEASEMDGVNTISDNLTVEEAELDKRFQNAQSDFALKNNMRLNRGKQIH